MSDEEPTTMRSIGGSSFPPTIGGRVGSCVDWEVGGMEEHGGPKVGGSDARVEGGGSLPPTMGGRESAPASPLTPTTASSPSSS